MVIYVVLDICKYVCIMRYYILLCTYDPTGGIVRRDWKMQAAVYTINVGLLKLTSRLGWTETKSDTLC